MPHKTLRTRESGKPRHLHEKGSPHRERDPDEERPAGVESRRPCSRRDAQRLRDEVLDPLAWTQAEGPGL